jgi:alanine racemase
VRQTFAQISLPAIEYNLNEIRRKVSPASVMAVVKADAYGHGATEVSRTAKNSGAAWLGVAMAEEAISLRKSGLDLPILVFSGPSEKEAPLYIANDLDATVIHEAALHWLQKAAVAANKQARVHIKIDTGMGRVGISWHQAADLIASIRSFDGLQLHGLYTHFAASDSLDKSYANLQLARFQQVLADLKRRQIKLPLLHAANSGAILDLPQSYFDMVRPGIMMYGYYPSRAATHSVQIEPSMSWLTHVIQVKTIGRGDSVSYNRLFIAEQPVQIATLPVGYADGYNRQLSNRSRVLIRGKSYPVVGQVCMDLIMVAVPVGEKIEIGDQAVLFGSQGQAQLPIEFLGDLLQTIPYEITCLVSKRVPRVYKHEKEST